METQTLDGPRLAPLSGAAAKQLVVITHGYGADGADLIGLGREWQPLLPDAAFVAPNAPERCAENPMGYQWFPLSFRDPSELWRGVLQAGPALAAFIDTELKTLGLDDGALALAGFSQGTMMALHVGLRRKTAPAAILGYSGILAGASHLKDQITARPPVFLSHGRLDEVIPVAALDYSRSALEAANVPVKWRISEGMGHGIDPEALSLGGAFLAENLAAKVI